jgi:hypothetical protein
MFLGMNHQLTQLATIDEKTTVETRPRYITDVPHNTSAPIHG